MAGQFTWQQKYVAYLKLEKSLSDNTVAAYQSDLQKLADFAGDRSLDSLSQNDIERFLVRLHELGIGARSQARIVSGLRSFYGFLLAEDFIQADPMEFIDSPNIGLHLPEVLSVNEIDRIIASIDASTPEGHRNRAMLETLYSCGLRVSELIGLKLSRCFFDEEYILVEGKGSKQRLVPISSSAIKAIGLWQKQRVKVPVQKGNEDYVFLSRRGTALSRSMVFRIIKSQAAAAGIDKVISPHTFRHSFATHLLEGGANLRVIQQMLGHESILTTEIYTHIDNTLLRSQILEFHPRNKHK